MKKGVRQGCVLSPALFNLYTDIIFRNIDQRPGIKIGGHTINNLRYADDTVLLAENETELQQILDTVKTESERYGLFMNVKKKQKVWYSPGIRIYLNYRVAKPHEFFVTLTKISSISRSPESSANLTKI